MPNLIEHAQTLESDEKIAEAIQTYADIIRSQSDSDLLAYANFRLGHIYQEWGELFAAQRFLSQAHQLNPENTDIRDAIDMLNQHFSENREQIADQMSRQNSDQIVSLFRIATGIKLIAMDKPVQAYPLMKSRTKIFPNAAVAKHLLTDISITDEERNSAIEFLIEREWLVNTGVELYTIADSGLDAFYIALAQLHVDNSAYSDAITCYDQAYWLDDSQSAPLYQKVICYASLEAWDEAIAAITELPAELSTEIDPIAYYTAVAESYHHTYQETGADSDKQKVIEACKAVLRLEKKDKAISKLLATYQDKKRWWRK
jgi:tetratricopeptide (TPR) repeat protein